MEKKFCLLDEAIIYATNAHAGVNRKGKGIPYIIHPLEVMTIVASVTDNQDVLAAAVLHDTMEDAGVKKDTLQLLFGERVANLVASESENKREKLAAESTWKTRKEETLERLQKDKDRDVKLICLGDKLANMREISRDYAVLKDRLWERFNQKDKSQHCWYYSSIYTILKSKLGNISPIREYGSLLKEVFNWDGDIDILEI